MKPPDDMIRLALFEAQYSPCRSKRGVASYVESDAGQVIIGMGHNGPPEPLACPGREVCAGTCGRRSVHAEMRALRNKPPEGMKVELVHVELAADGGVVACDGPRCEQCSREILDVGFVAGVWLYETAWRPKCSRDPLALRMHWKLDQCGNRVNCETCGGDGFIGQRVGVWRRYTAEEFYLVTLKRCGMTP